MVWAPHLDTDKRKTVVLQLSVGAGGLVSAQAAIEPLGFAACAPCERRLPCFAFTDHQLRVSKTGPASCKRCLRHAQEERAAAAAAARPPLALMPPKPPPKLVSLQLCISGGAVFAACCATAKERRGRCACPAPGCKHVATSASQLAQHMLFSHSGEKPHACPFAGCAVRCTVFHQLQTHLILAHWGQQLPAAPPDGEANSAAAKTRSTPIVRVLTKERETPEWYAKTKTWRDLNLPRAAAEPPLTDNGAGSSGLQPDGAAQPQPEQANGEDGEVGDLHVQAFPVADPMGQDLI